jgi:hypothetical protein
MVDRKKCKGRLCILEMVTYNYQGVIHNLVATAVSVDSVCVCGVGTIRPIITLILFRRNGS